MNTKKEINSILTKEEQEFFGWPKEINTVGFAFKDLLITPLLKLASYKEYVGISSVLADASSICIPSILSILKEKVVDIKKGDWRIIISGLVTIRIMIYKHKQCPEIPVLYLKILNSFLTNKTKTLRKEAILAILFVAYILYQRYIGSHEEYTKDDMNKFAMVINPSRLKKAIDLKEYINSLEWHNICERWIGYKWEYPSIEPNFNTNLATKVFRSYWRNFSF